MPQAPPRELPPFVRPTGELRWLGRTWLVLGLVVLGADIASGAIPQLSSLQLLGALGLLGFSVVGSVASMTLGVRTPLGSLYGRRFDRAPRPPTELEIEAAPLTASRARWAAIVVAVMLSIAAPVAVAIVLVLLGTPTDMVPRVVPAAAGLEAAGWLLACAAAARQLRRWVIHWETRRGRVLFCPPLLSGRLAPVYYSAPRVADSHEGFERGGSGIA